MISDLSTSSIGNTITLTSGEAIAVSAEETGAVELHAPAGEVKFVAIAGPGINEPIVQMGPFVMSSREELEQAIADFQTGEFGAVAPFARPGTTTQTQQKRSG
jgi:hypothetical protein